MKPGIIAITTRTCLLLTLCASTISLAGSYSVPAQAAPSKNARANEIFLSYDVHGAGFKLMTIDFDIVLTGNKYQAKSNLQTVGFAKFFTAIKATYETKGRFSHNRLRPASFKMLSSKKKKKRGAVVSWSKGGKPKIVATPPLKKDRKKAVLKALKAGMPDPLTALLALTLSRAKAPCKLARRVLDGRKVFQLKFSFLKQVNVKSTHSKIYQGKAFHCVITNRPIAGYSDKTMAKISAKPKPPFNVWLVPVKESGLGRPFLVPLFVTGTTNFAEISVRLTKALINGKSLKSLSLARK